MSFSAPRCAVTGATGYVGSRISEYFAARGWTVFEFARRPSSPSTPSRISVPYQLDSAIHPTIFRDNGIEAVIHCAYDFRPTTWKEIRRVNIEGSARLFRAAKEAGVRKIVLLSSISAFDGCASLYGRAKLEIEKIAFDVGAFSIRSGLVFGSGPSGGMFASLRRLAAKSTIIPLIGSGEYLQYLTHEDDLCELILGICTGQISLDTTPIIAAAAQGWQLRDLLRVLAAPYHRSIKFLSLPWRIIWLGLKIPELLGIGMPFRSDSVISLVRQNPHPDFSTTAQLSYKFRELQMLRADAAIDLRDGQHRT
jgi:nucleoside-diphosphate-sugar epimerase